MRLPTMSSLLVAEAAALAYSSVTKTMMMSVGGCVASPILLPCYAPHQDAKIENDNISNMDNTDNTGRPPEGANMVSPRQGAAAAWDHFPIFAFFANSKRLLGRWQ